MLPATTSSGKQAGERKERDGEKRNNRPDLFFSFSSFAQMPLSILISASANIKTYKQSYHPLKNAGMNGENDNKASYIAMLNQIRTMLFSLSHLLTSSQSLDIRTRMFGTQQSVHAFCLIDHVVTGFAHLEAADSRFSNDSTA